MSTTLITDVASSAHDQRNAGQTVWTDETTCYVFIADGAAGGHLWYHKSIDGGANWGAEVVISDPAGVTVPTMAVWYDVWTNGIAGSVIHIVSTQSLTDRFEYWELDTSTDTLTGPVTIFQGVSMSNTAFQAHAGIVKTRDGNLIAAAWGEDTAGEGGTFRSTDNGLNWSVIDDLRDGELALDLFYLMPGNETAPADCWCIYWDDSADELTLKVYSQSGDTWTESAAITTGAYAFDTDVIPNQFGVAPDNSDDSCFIILIDVEDGANDIRFIHIEDSTTFTLRTDVVGSATNGRCCDLAVNQQTGRIYAIYGGKADGSEALDSTAFYMKTSDDKGVTWSAEIVMATQLDDQRGISLGTSHGNTGGKVAAVWYNKDLTDVYIEPAEGSVVIPASPFAPGSKADFLEQLLLDAVFKLGAFSIPSTLYLALFTVGPEDNGSGTEVSAASYSRQAVTTAGWTRAVGTSRITNDNTIDFGEIQPTDLWGNLSGMAIFDAASGGNALYIFPLSVVTAANESVQIAAGALVIDER